MTGVSVRVLCGAIPIVFSLLSAHCLGSPESDRLQMLELVNTARKSASLSELTLSEDLNRIAQDHCRQLVRFNVTTHDDPETGQTLTDRIEQSPILAAVASENIGTGKSIRKIHEKLLKSPKHLENIMDPEITHCGFGIASRNDHLFIVQDFARIIPASTPMEIIEFLKHQINSTRTANHLQILIEDPILRKLAHDHTERMIEEDRLFFPSLGSDASRKVYCVTTPEISNTVFDFNIYARHFVKMGIYFRQAKTVNQPMGIWWGVVLFE